MVGAVCGNSVMNYCGAHSEISVSFVNRIADNFGRVWMPFQDR
jgi:hypothetical protein